MKPRTFIKSLIPTLLFRQVEPYGHWTEAVIAQNKFRFPAKNLNVVGVTGTDGKTTTCQLIASVLRAGGKKTAYITTTSVDYGDGKGDQPNPTSHGLTTGNANELASLIDTIKQNGVEWLVLEVSSHALNQRRVWGIPFTIGVMTNMSPEHLDYHQTFKNYRLAKEKLFKLVSANRRGLGIGVINADDATAPFFKKHVKKTVMYGVKKGDMLAKDIQSSLNGNQFTVSVEGKNHTFSTNLIGDFNVYNALAAISVGRSAGLSWQDIQLGINAIKHVSGRMMPVKAGQPFDVLIDYAVTPGALQNVLTTIRNVADTGKIHIVFGATGDRDKTKRPAMGRVTSELADYVYLTDDETYTEDASQIRSEVLGGVIGSDKDKVSEYDDRERAISTALSNAKKGDIVIIAGIGHQTIRNMGGKKMLWSDTDIVKKILKNRNNT